MRSCALVLVAVVILCVAFVSAGSGKRYCKGGKIYGRYGQEYDALPNPCKPCTCRYGKLKCVTIDCPKPYCDNPYKVEGKCCPECKQGCVFYGKNYNEGDDVPSEDPCEMCKCTKGKVECVRMGCTTLPPYCESYTPSGKCCPECKTGCEYYGKKYEEGDDVPSKNPCEMCKCTKGKVECLTRGCPPLPEYCDPYTPPGQCCRECKTGCEYYGKKYEEGDSFPSNDTCSQCTCTKGKVDCLKTGCPPPPSYCESYTPPGKCCPECKPGCYLWDGTYYKEGDDIPSDDKCQLCRCFEENVECNNFPCPPPPPYCDRPYTPPGQCCPECKTGCDYNGKPYDEDGSVPSDNKCEVCKCVKGKVVCAPIGCPTTPPDCIKYTPPGKCCPECKTGCVYNDKPYDEGASFPSSNKCEVCNCIKGKVECAPIGCPTLPPYCEKYTPEGKCCPECKADIGCELNGKKYKEGEKVPSPNPCRICTCEYGKINCKDVKCKKCAAYKPPDKCCC